MMLALTGALTASAAGIRLSTPGGGNYAVGQTFSIVISMENVNGNVSLTRDVPGCYFVGANQTQSRTTVASDGRGNARMQSSKTIELLVQAERPGSYTFGPIKAGGMQSNTVSYTISGSPAPASSSVTVPENVANSDIIIQASVSDKNPYVQQGIKYDITLYTRVPVNWPQLNNPKFENCTFEVLPGTGTHDLKRATLNGKEYMALELYSMIVYPSKVGKSVLKGGDAVVPISPFEEVKVDVNDIEIDVKDLPDIADHKDVNGVGDYTLTMDVLSKEFRTGEAAKVSFTIKGIGNPAFVSLPDNLADMLPDGFKLLKSESNIQKDIVTGGISATITFDCYIIPSKTGDFELPAFTFTFFDPDKGEWYTRSTEPRSVNVQQGSQDHEGDDSLVFDSELQPVGEGSGGHTYYISSLVYWLFYLVPLVALIVAFMLYRKRLALMADPELMKHRKANTMARKRLRAAAAAMKKNDTDLFYDEMLKAVWGYLSDKLAIPTSDLSRDNISNELKKAGVTDEMTERTIRFIDDCEFAKYASAAGSDMPGAYDRATEIINTLEAQMKSNSPTAKDK